MDEFMIGDRVIARGNISGLWMAGRTGTIRELGPNPGIEFDEPFDEGHDLCGLCKDGHGRWARRDDKIEILDESEHIDMEHDTAGSLEMFLEEFIRK